MTSNVASLVLRNNYLQSQALTVELAGSRTKADAHARLMRDLERSGHLDREVEFLPNEELMTERLQSGNTLTRPELAILLASAKINVFSELIDSDISEDNYLAEDLHFYFPEAIQSSHSDSVFIHPLRKEIIATSVANSMINRAGCSFVNEMVKLTKRPVSEISRAYAAARHVFCLRELWLEIESLDNKVDSKLQTEMLIEVGRLLEHGTVWFLKTKGNKIDISEIIEEFADGVATLGEVIEDVLSPEQLVKVHRARSKLLEKGVPEGISKMIAAVDPLLSACDIVEISREIKIDVSKAAKAYFSIGSEFYIDWIRDSASELSLGSHWKHQAVDAIHNDLFIQQRSLCLSVLRTFNHSNSVETAILDYRKSNKNIINPTFEVLEDLKAYEKFDLAMLTVANAQIRSLIFDKS